jgi:hypothetical protein
VTPLRSLFRVALALSVAAPVGAQAGAWSPVGRGLDNVWALQSHDDGSGAALYAGGWFSAPGGGASDHVARWNGDAWTFFGGGAIAHTNPYAGGVLCFAAYDAGGGRALYAGGVFDRVNGAPANHIARWDGTSWSAVPTSSAVVFPVAVTALTVFDDGTGPALYTGGTQQVSIWSTYYVLRWDGTQWTRIGNFPSYYVTAALTALEVFDAGSGPTLHALGVLGLLHGWGGSDSGMRGRWAAITGGFSPTQTNFWNAATLWPQTFDLEGHDGGLFVAGDFTDVYVGSASLASRGVVRWDGNAWSSLAGGVTGSVEALLSHDDGSGARLYAGGRFTQAGGTSAANVAVWDGTTWSALGSGVADTRFGKPRVRAFASHDDGSGAAIYVGGRFTHAGGRRASGIARWSLEPGCP